MRRLFLSLFHLSWPIQGGAVCMAFLLAGMATATDYSVVYDTLIIPHRVERNLAYIMGEADQLDGFYIEHNRYYGVAFDLLLVLLERGLELEDSRDIHLLRHLVTHGFFLIGGLCCSLLVYRLSNRRGVALVALLLFLLQPRLYAHSFFNSKDLPFLSMFMVTLYVTHRAFRKETVGAFVLCGVSVGMLTNLRIMGVMLFPAVLALRGLDFVQGGGGRKQVVVTGAVFALAGPGTLYALSPYLWANPVEFVTAWSALAHHANRPGNELFQGALIDPHHLPWHYIPTWIGISTPPVTLVCGVLGVIVVGVRSLREPRTVVGNTDLRFWVLLGACLTLPVLAIIAFGSHMYNDWRHVYFLHAPLSCLAALGVQWAGGKAPVRVAVVSALVGLGVLVTGREMVRLHPYQHVYFNALVDRTTPEYLRTHYILDPWMTSCREGLDFLRRRYPITTVHVQIDWKLIPGRLSLPKADRPRLALVQEDADIQIQCGKALQSTRFKGPPIRGLPFEADRGIITELSPENALYVRKVYNSTLLTVTGLMTVPDRKQSVTLRAEDTYRGATTGRLLAKGMFDIYTYPGTRLLGYARRRCTPPDTRPWFFLHIVPVDEEALPTHRRQYGFDNRDFTFQHRGKQVAGRCWATVELPAYEIARIRTGQYNEQGRLWETELVRPLP